MNIGNGYNSKKGSYYKINEYRMSKLLLYKILFIANVTISILLLSFIVIFHPSGRSLFLSIFMIIIGLLGALSMYSEIRRNSKPEN